jgi:hypothetical protein
MRGRLLLAHRPGRSLRLPRDRRGDRPRTTASPLGAVGTILGPGWGHAIRPITAGRAIGGGDRRRARAGALTLGAAGIGWVFASPVRAGALAMLLSANMMWSRPRAQRRDESVTATLGSPGVLRQLEQKLLCIPKIRFCNIGDEGAQSREGTGHLCSASDEFVTRCNFGRRNLAFGAGGPRPRPPCGRHIHVGSIRSIARRRRSAKASLGRWACRGCP